MQDQSVFHSVVSAGLQKRDRDRARERERETESEGKDESESTRVRERDIDIKLEQTKGKTRYKQSFCCLSQCPALLYSRLHKRKGQRVSMFCLVSVSQIKAIVLASLKGT